MGEHGVMGAKPYDTPSVPPPTPAPNRPQHHRCCCCSEQVWAAIVSEYDRVGGARLNGTHVRSRRTLKAKVPTPPVSKFRISKGGSVVMSNNYMGCDEGSRAVCVDGYITGGWLVERWLVGVGGGAQSTLLSGVGKGGGRPPLGLGRWGGWWCSVQIAPWPPAQSSVTTSPSLLHRTSGQGYSRLGGAVVLPPYRCPQASACCRVLW